MDTNAILTQALTESVDEMAGIISLSPKIIDEDIAQSVEEGVSSKIFIKGAFNGRIIFLTDTKSACQIVSNMLGTAVEECTDEVLDGIGEVVNMAIGGIKSRCVNQGYNFEISIPSTRVLTRKEGPVTSKGELIQKDFVSDDIKFQIRLIYRVAEGTEKEEPPQEETKKPSAADLLSQMINKKD